MHIILDCSIQENNNLNSSTIKTWLEEMPEKIDMTRISPAIVEGDSESLKGIVLLAESHCSFHMDYSSNKIWIDIFSCKNIDINIVKLEVLKLGIDIINIRILSRGLEYFNSLK